MRLVGFAVTHPDGPARWGYLELDDLTVVLGPNDAGKSRIAKWLASWLAHAPPTSDEAGIASGALFAAACAAGWLGERAFGLHNPLQAVSDWLSPPPSWFAIALGVASAASLAILAWRARRPVGLGTALDGVC